MDKMKKGVVVLVVILVLPLVHADWKYQTKERVYDFKVIDYNGDGEEEIAVGSEFLHVVDFDGNLLKKFDYPGNAFDFSKVYLVPSFAAGGTDEGYLIDYLGNLVAECSPIEGDVHTAFIRDIDSDARKELLFATEDTIYLFYRNGNPKHSREIPEIRKVECVDIDGNGDLEVIVAADKFYVLDKDLNDLWYCCSEAESFLTHDFDGDGTLEIVIGGEDLLFYEENGLMYWKIPLDKEVVDIFPSDYDSDGTDEILLLDRDTLSAYDEEGIKEWEVEYPSHEPLSAAYIDDLDGDGNKEILLGVGNHVVVLEDEKKVGTYRTTYATDEIFKIRTHDLDGDGKKEILASSWRFFNVFTYEKQLPPVVEEEEEEEEEPGEEDEQATLQQIAFLLVEVENLFKEKKYIEAKTKANEAKSLAQGIGESETESFCDQLISLAYKGINGDKYFSTAGEREAGGDYEGAIKEYELAKEQYQQLNTGAEELLLELDSDKEDLCTQKIAELEEKMKSSQIVEYIPIIVIIAAIAGVLAYTMKMVMKKK